jgi:hypothetical protein
MATMGKSRVTLLRFLLAIVIAYLPLQSVSAQSCCADAMVTEHAGDTGTDGHGDGSHDASDCCSCCNVHLSCGDEENCAGSACSHASQFIPAMTFAAFAPPTFYPSTGPPGLHSDSPPYQKAKPPRYLIT